MDVTSDLALLAAGVLALLLSGGVGASRLVVLVLICLVARVLLLDSTTRRGDAIRHRHDHWSRPYGPTARGSPSTLPAAMASRAMGVAHVQQGDEFSEGDTVPNPRLAPSPAAPTDTTAGADTNDTPGTTPPSVPASTATADRDTVPHRGTATAQDVIDWIHVRRPDRRPFERPSRERWLRLHRADAAHLHGCNGNPRSLSEYSTTPAPYNDRP